MWEHVLSLRKRRHRSAEDGLGLKAVKRSLGLRFGSLVFSLRTSPGSVILGILSWLLSVVPWVYQENTAKRWFSFLAQSFQRREVTPPG